MDDERRYAELGQMWRHFVLWREKIVAGYLTALAGLGIAFWQNESPPFRAAVFGGGILVSIVFWILDLRNQQFVNACQDAAAALEGKQGGGYTTLSSLRDHGEQRATLGLGIKLLVGGVITASSGGLCIYVVKWWQGDFSKPAVTIALVTALLVPRLLRWLGTNRGVRWGLTHRVATLLGVATILRMDARRRVEAAAEQGAAADEARAGMVPRR